MLSVNIGLQATLLSWLTLSTPILAQTMPDGLPRLPTAPAESAPVAPASVEPAPVESAPAESAPAESETIQNNSSNDSSAASVVELTLPDLLNIVIQGNRDIKNDVLERVVQRQTLNEAESRFDPRFTPNLSLQASRNGSENITEEDTEDSTEENTPENTEENTNNFLGPLDAADGSENTTLSQSLGVSSTLTTPLGTAITLSVEPLRESSRLNITVNQPLLRGSGQAVNRAPVQQARIAASNQALALRQKVIETVTTSINQYTTLAQRQEAVSIQAQALERRRQQFEIVQALVEAGRQARIDLIDSERSIAEAELGLQEAKNQLAQTNTELLNLIGTEATLQFAAPDDAISQLFAAAAARVSQFQLDQMVELAYQIQPDYQQAKANIELEDLGLLVAQDDQRWNLNWQSSAGIGEASSQMATGLQLSRTFGDESLDTAVERSQTNILQQQNTLAQLTETIRNDIAAQLRDVNSQLAQVELAQRATQAVQLQLEVAQEKFRLGRDDITLFNITEREEALVNAQNTELEARISVLNSIAGLEKAVGITLDTWQPLVDFSSVLAES
jgi:outer membrane protein